VQPSGTGIVLPQGTGLSDKSVAQIIRNLLTWLLGIVGVIAIIGFVISGIQYLTSAGNEDQMQSAKRNLLYSIIGVVVVLASFVIIQAIQYALEAKSMF
jgi:Na+-driven multidrug efflux pump